MEKKDLAKPTAQDRRAMREQLKWLRREDGYPDLPDAHLDFLIEIGLRLLFSLHGQESKLDEGSETVH